MASNILLLYTFSALNMVVPASRMLDEMIANGSPVIPENVLRAQQDRFSVYAKISISFPRIFPPGDGDGMTGCELIEVGDLFCNENVIGDDFACFYQKLKDMTGQELRCRLVGFDTQETDLPVTLKSGHAAKHVGVPQPFWEMGKQFLTAQLLELNGDIPQNDAVLACDCFGVDIFDRLLVDVRSVRSRREDANAIVPERSLLNRFEMAERFLENGVAHPTYGSYTSENLLRAFSAARQNCKGAFADPEGRAFVHPCVYRNARRRLVTMARKRNRPQYKE